MPGKAKSYVALLEQHARDGDGQALWELALVNADGLRDANGTLLVERNQHKAVRLYRRGVELGHTGCMVNLASHLAAGRGARRDQAAAQALDLRAARKGEPTAALNVAISYRAQGNHRAALRWFRKAGQMGNDVSLEIAKAQLYGSGTRRDIPAAIRGLKQAARSVRLSDAEREEARLLLAYLHLDGSLVRRSHAEGVRWLARAEQKGSAIARLYKQCVTS